MSQLNVYKNEMLTVEITDGIAGMHAREGIAVRQVSSRKANFAIV